MLHYLLLQHMSKIGENIEIVGGENIEIVGGENCIDFANGKVTITTKKTKDSKDNKNNIILSKKKCTKNIFVQNGIDRVVVKGGKNTFNF